MSWNICFRGKSEDAKFGLELICNAVREYEKYEPDVSDSIPLGEEDDIIILSCREGNNCQKKEMDALAGAKIPSGEGYLVRFGDHPYNLGRRMILVTSETERGMMRGCAAFADCYLPEAAHRDGSKNEGRNPFKEGFADVTYAFDPSARSVSDRGDSR